LVSDPLTLQESDQGQSIANLEWALRRVQEWTHGTPTLVDAFKTPSRLAVVHRLTTSIDGTPRVFYLKEYSAGSIEDEHEFWPNLKRLQSASAAFGGDPHVAPLEIAAIDETRRLLLTAAVEGPTIADLHHGWIAPAFRMPDIVSGWRAAGRWLRTLIAALPSYESVDRPSFLLGFTRQRLEWWVRSDPSAARFAAHAGRALDVLQRHFADRSVQLVACHGDVSAHNVVVGTRVGLIDVDDFRFEMAGLDVSQAHIEIAEFSRIARILRFPPLRLAAERAFHTGYGEPSPSGPELWLPHMRNLAVRVLTLARKERGLRPSRLHATLSYRWAIGELRKTATEVLSSGAP
jgi:hypothetical protein